ncbi:MAG: hypothetical protein AAF703_16425 [Cyanobacteria bacterium P01_D01_bin.105]
MKVLGPLLGFLLVVATIATGFIHIAQWIVLVLGALFTAAYIGGKWTIWQDVFAKRDSPKEERLRQRKAYQSLAATYVVETIIVFSLYWLGRGVSGLIG